MKIALTTYSLPPFDSIGAGVQNHYLANHFVKSGHEVMVFSPHSSAPSDALYKHTGIQLTGKLRTIKWAIELSKIDFSDYDYVHCTGDDHFVKTKKQTCHLRQFHGNSFSEFKHARDGSAKLRNLFLYSTELASSLRADILTCVSSRAASALPKRTVVVPCGVDLSTFTPGGRKSENPSILFVGILDSRKRGDLLVDVFVTKVKKSLPTAVLNIVRESKQVTHADVNVHGFVDQQTLVDLYRSSWIFCLPSSYEGFGVPYIEAMGCGTAVVATANAGSLDVLETGKYGVISSPDSLGDDLVALIADNNRLQSFQTQGVQRSKDFAWSTIVLKYVSLVNSYHGS